MSYTDHFTPEDPPRRPLFSYREGLARANQVTRLSKVLSIVLFVFLPFGGFWLGLQYAPVITVTVPASANVPPSGAGEERTDKDPRENGEDAAERIVPTDSWRTYRDSETGLSFSYPPSWGDVSVGSEPGDCPRGYDDDSCMMRLYSMDEPDGAESAVFLVATTPGHGLYPVARGAFWGDRIHAPDSSYLADCSEQSHCSVVAATEQPFVRYREQVELGGGIGDASGGMAWYFTQVPEQEFDRFAFSFSDLAWATDRSEAHERAVLNSVRVE